jgi:soluble P-type ATPase
MKAVTLVLSFLLMTGLHAQDSTAGKRSIERIATMQLQQIKQRITTLSTEQTSSLQKIFDVFGKDLSEVMDETQPRAKMELFKKANNKKDVAVENLLNKEQQKIYADLQKEWKERMQQQGKEGRRKRN